MNASQNEETRHMVLEFLAVRHPAALNARQIHRSNCCAGWAMPRP
jgi:hypothetical protein